MPKNLNILFSPGSVVVIGASRNPEKVGSFVLSNIINSKYKGELYAINPNADSILGIKCYKNVAELPKIVDLAIIAIPVEKCLEELENSAKFGIKNFVILTAGFKEIGAEGAILEKQLQAIIAKYALNVLGPNCMGFVNNSSPINATFGQEKHINGNLRFITQSGAIAASLFDWLYSTNLGFSEFITLGNKTDINENDVLEYFINKANSVTSLAEESASGVNPIGLYLESIANGEEFFRLTKQLSKKDPVFIIKPGKTKAAASAMLSHTGAIAGADDVLEEALDEAGVIRCDTLESFFDLAKAFSWETVPNGPKVAIISNAGGPAVISADSVMTNGLEICQFDDETKNKLVSVLPRTASILDPVDVLGDALADRFAEAADIVLQTEACDSLLVILTPQVMTQIVKTADLLGQITKKYHKPIFCSFIGGHVVSEGENKLNEYKIPSFKFPEQAISAIGLMWKYKKQQLKILHEIPDISVLNTQLMTKKATDIVQNACKRGALALDNLEANDVVAEAGISTPPTKIATDLKDATTFAQNIGFPIALKLSSPGLLHKKHVGGVILDIRNEEQLEAAWNTLERKLENLDQAIITNVKFQVQKEIPNGIETIIGIKQDPTFGPVLLFGAGGSLAELILDKNLHLLPIDIGRAKEIVQQSRIYPLLAGQNGEPSYALDKLYETIVKLSKIAQDLPEIQSIEINPVIVTLNDVSAVDVKVVLEPNTKIPSGPKYKVANTSAIQLLAGKIRYFDFDAEDPLNILPGQYVSVKVSNTRINCYSVASHPSPTKFSLLIDSSPGGPGSKFFESLKVGDKIAYLGPFGKFVLKTEDGAKRYIFLATGSGFAPLKNLIESALKINPKQSINLYIGVTNYEDIFFKDYFTDLAKKYVNFKYEFAVCNKNPMWTGHVGFITELVKRDFPNAKDCSVYMCGNKFMVIDATKLLETAGCPTDRIYCEKI